ncbi:multiple epidermal growth factor-like domains protein 6 [Plakobranchus ocellatus]|uniref:Multiple epidermal growth factor-like domains protein 6 n=1 Tax=Plakobranchus ocellatus TaxID=259542 RepID=A0AAV3Y957_9GAST|nr:multiple epidermal growth factor-like domains protein 6 [Plakobranchus ocellatus]
MIARLNGSLMKMLNKLVAEKPEDWDKLLPIVLCAYKEVPNTSTGYAPFKLIARSGNIFTLKLQTFVSSGSALSPPISLLGDDSPPPPPKTAQFCAQTRLIGNDCIFQCHCANNAGCDQTTGACSNGCDPQWFGPACQYDVSEFAINSGSGSGLSVLTDNNDTPCVSGYLQPITVTLETPHPLSWIRVVSNTAHNNQFQLSYKEESSTSFTPCMNPRTAKVDDLTLDISCPTLNSVAELTLSGPIINGICSLYINGGRNVALKQTADQSSTAYDGWVASNAVDGDPGVPAFHDSLRKTCTHTQGGGDTSDSWEVTFSWAVKIDRFQIYNRRNPDRDCCEARLVNFTLQAFPSSGSDPTYTYTDPGGPAQDIYSVVPSPRIGFAVKTVKIDTSKNNLGILTLCEVLIFGEVVCQSGKFGRQCERDCNCADQTEACFVSTGGCPSGCAAGYTGEDCYTLCSPGRYGVDCKEQCSMNCAGQNNLCSREDGRCNEGCDAGYQTPKCDVGPPSGKGASGRARTNNRKGSWRSHVVVMVLGVHSPAVTIVQVRVILVIMSMVDVHKAVIQGTKELIANRVRHSKCLIAEKL